MDIILDVELMVWKMILKLKCCMFYLKILF